MTFSDLVQRAHDGTADGYAALTFDDGLADNLTTLVPLLRETDAVATIFITTGWLDGTHPATGHRMLRRLEVRELAGEPRVEIGGHTHSHPDLTTTTYEVALDEFRLNKTELEELIMRPVRAAAYPFGPANLDAKRACRDAGFIACCHTSGEGDWNDPFSIPRQDMASHQTSLSFWLKRKNLYEPIVATLPGRAVRKALRVLRTLRG